MPAGRPIGKLNSRQTHMVPSCGGHFLLVAHGEGIKTLPLLLARQVENYILCKCVPDSSSSLLELSSSSSFTNNNNNNTNIKIREARAWKVNLTVIISFVIVMLEMPPLLPTAVHAN